MITILKIDLKNVRAAPRAEAAPRGGTDAAAAAEAPAAAAAAAGAVGGGEGSCADTPGQWW